MIKLTIDGVTHEFKDDELSTGAEKAEWFLNQYNKERREF